MPAYSLTSLQLSNYTDVHLKFIEIVYLILYFKLYMYFIFFSIVKSTFIFFFRRSTWD